MVYAFKNFYDQSPWLKSFFIFVKFLGVSLKWHIFLGDCLVLWKFHAYLDNSLTWQFQACDGDYSFIGLWCDDNDMDM